MKLSLDSLFKSFREPNTTPKMISTGMPDMDELMHQQIAHCKQKYPEEFQREVARVKQNIDWLASERLLDRLEWEHDNKRSQMENPLEERGIHVDTPDYAKPFDAVLDELHSDAPHVVEEGPELEPGD